MHRRGYLQGVLKVYTGCVNEDTEYKTLRISTSHTAKNVIDTIIGKFRISYRDPNLFEIVMEVRTRIRECEVGDIINTTRKFPSIINHVGFGDLHAQILAATKCLGYIILWHALVHLPKFIIGNSSRVRSLISPPPKFRHRLHQVLFVCITSNV